MSNYKKALVLRFGEHNIEGDVKQSLCRIANTNGQIKVSNKMIFFQQRGHLAQSLNFSQKGFSHWSSCDLKLCVEIPVSAIQHIGNSKSV